MVAELMFFNGTVKSISHIVSICRLTRSTFSAELLSGGDAVDQGMLMSQLMHELAHGPMTATEARDQRLNGGYKNPQVLYLDAMSVFAAVNGFHQNTSGKVFVVSCSVSA